MAEWISVEDRLPDNFASVLCHCKNSSTGGECATIGSCDKGFWFLQERVGGQSYPHHYYEVTHWMPLPEPPQKERATE